MELRFALQMRIEQSISRGGALFNGKVDSRRRRLLLESRFAMHMQCAMRLTMSAKLFNCEQRTALNSGNMFVNK